MAIPPVASAAGSLPVYLAEAGVAPTPPATLPLPTGAATSAKQSDGTQLARAMGIEGANQRQLRVDASGSLYLANPTANPETGLAKDSSVNAPARGTVLTPVPSSDWTGTPWDGAAPKKLTVRTGAGPVWIVQAYLSGGGGGGGVATCALHLGPVGFTVGTGSRLVQLAIPIADSAVVSPLAGRVLVRADANGQIDAYVIPNVGTTAKVLEVEVVAA